MASTDAKPLPQKNVAYRLTIPILDADGDLVSGATGLDSEISKDGGTFADCTNEATEIATSSGMYYLDLTAAEMNADTVAIIVKTTSSGAKTTPIVLYPEEAGDVRVNVTQVSGDTTAADNLELDYDGTGYTKANSTIGTTTTNTDMRGTDSAFLAASAPTNFGDLAITVTTGKVTVGTNSDKTGYSITGTVTDLDTLQTNVKGSLGASIDLTKMAQKTTGGAYDADTDSLEAVRDRGDTAWTTGGGGSDPALLQNTTIATLASQTSFTLTAGSADNDAYKGALAIITDSATSTQKAVGIISAYTGATKTVTLQSDPAVFTMAAGDTIDVVATDKVALAYTSTRGGYLDNINGHTAQTGDTFAQLPTNFSALSISAGGLVDILQTAADKVWSSATRTLTAFSTSLAVSVWDVLETAIATASSIGLKVKNNLDAAITSRQASGSVDLNADQSSVTVGTVNALGAQAKLDVNAEVDNALDTAIPTVPTADSINERVKAIDNKLPTGTISDFDESADNVTVGTNNDKTGYSVSGTKTTLDALNDISTSQVNTEVVDALNVDTYAEPGQSAPSATATLVQKIGYVYKFLRNKIETTSTTIKVYNDDGTTVAQKSTISDDGTTFTRGEFGTGP